MHSDESRYEAVIRALMAKNCHAELQRPGQLVVCLKEPVLTGRIWITWKQQWFISTWVPTVYAVPDDGDVVDLCVACVAHKQDAFYQLPDQIVRQYRLRMLNAAEQDELLVNSDFDDEE